MQNGKSSKISIPILCSVLFCFYPLLLLLPLLSIPARPFSRAAMRNTEKPHAATITIICRPAQRKKRKSREKKNRGKKPKKNPVCERKTRHERRIQQGRGGRPPTEQNAKAFFPRFVQICFFSSIPSSLLRFQFPLPLSFPFCSKYSAPSPPPLRLPVPSTLCKHPPNAYTINTRKDLPPPPILQCKSPSADPAELLPSRSRGVDSMADGGPRAGKGRAARFVSRKKLQ